MKNKANWVPTKFILDTKGRLKSSRDFKEVGAGSRLMANMVAEHYDKYLKEYCKGELLDLGCGKVPLYAAYKNYITDNTCVDWSNSFHKNEHLDYECDLTKNLPFSDSMFDTIILSDVLEHIPNPENLWKEMSRIIKKDGALFLNVPFFYQLHEAPYDYYRYTQFMLKRFAEENGFRILVLTATGGSLEVMADFFSKHFRFIPLIGNPLSLLIQKLVYWFGKTKSGAKLSAKTSEGFPYGYFMVARKI